MLRTVNVLVRGHVYLGDVELFLKRNSWGKMFIITCDQNDVFTFLPWFSPSLEGTDELNRWE